MHSVLTRLPLSSEACLVQFENCRFHMLRAEEEEEEEEQHGRQDAPAANLQVQPGGASQHRSRFVVKAGISMMVIPWYSA